MSSGGRDEPLKRDIGFLGSAFLSFNGLVGAGIFVLPGTLHDRFGTAAPLLFPLFGLLALAIAIPFARTASHFGTSGGPVAYAAVFGPLASLQAGWVYYVARVAAAAANVNVLATYLAAVSPGLGGPWARAAMIAGAIGLLAAINVAGVRRAVRLIDLLTLLKALPLLLLAGLGLAVSGLPAPPSAAPPLSELEAAALLILYAFVGFENSTVAAGETADARRTIPRAMLTTIVATALLYTVLQLAYSATVAPGQGGDAPMVTFGRALLGPTGAVIITLTAIASLLGNVGASVTSTPRATYALARDGLLPGWFARVPPTSATPVVSILIFAALVIILAISGSFVWLAVVSTLARMFVYAIGAAALLRLEPGRKRWWLPIALVVALCAWAAAQSTAQAWWTLAVLAGLGLPLYLIARR